MGENALDFNDLEGKRVELVKIFDPYESRLKPGDQGTVEFVDALGTVFVKWDNGSGLGLVKGVDEYRILKGGDK